MQQMMPPMFGNRVTAGSGFRRRQQEEVNISAPGMYSGAPQSPAPILSASGMLPYSPSAPANTQASAPSMIPLPGRTIPPRATSPSMTSGSLAAPGYTPMANSSAPLMNGFPSTPLTATQHAAAKKRVIDATSDATFAEAAPPPVTAEGWARRKAFIARQRLQAGMPAIDDASLMVPGEPTGPSLRDKAAAYNAVARATGDPEQAGTLSGLTGPSAPAPRAPSSPYAGPAPANLPRESDYDRENAPKQAAAAATRKKSFPITTQHAQRMWQNIAEAGVDQEGYDPKPIFAALMRQYGVSQNEANEMSRSFTELANNPNAAKAYLNPAQRKQVAGAEDQVAKVQELSPFAAGGTMPGYNPINRGPIERKAGPDGVMREKRSDGLWHPISE